MTEQSRNCWCGNKKLSPFSDSYQRCDSCSTLVSQTGLSPEEIVVTSDEQDFYGLEYWQSHQTEDLGQPDVFTRSRTDLPERCLHWLRTLLKYKVPPGNVLELGCAHGGFVKLLSQAGFTATGLELSPSVVEFASKTFGVPILCGPVEDQNLAPASLDVIALMDVIEHLPDPLATMLHCLNLLKPDGIMLVQCPCYSEKMTYEEMVKDDSPFLIQLKSDEHLYLFTESSIRLFFEKIGAEYLEFESAIFDHYDMFFVVSRTPLKQLSPEDLSNSLLTTPDQRILLALIDFYDVHEITELDRAERLKVIHEHSAEIHRLMLKTDRLEQALESLPVRILKRLKLI